MVILSIGFSGFAGQGEAKCCAVIDGALGPDFTPMAVNDPLHGCQTDARATKLALIVQTLEGLEQITRVRHVKTRAVVAHEIGSGAVRLGQCRAHDSP